MAKKTNFDYDKKADILYISFSPGEEATSAVELNIIFYYVLILKRKEPLA